MATTLRRLRWVLEVDSRDFDRNMDRVRSRFRRLGRVAARGLAAVGIGALFQRAVSLTDELGKMAQAANVGVEALQELRFAAELAGVPTAQFDQALLAFNRRLGDLQLRGGPLFSFLRRYNEGLLFALARTEDTTRALTLFAEAVRRAPSDQLQAALTAAGFGRGGLRLVNLLRGGARGLAAGRLEARRTLDITTEEMTRTAASLADAQLRAQERLNTQVMNMLIRIGGWVEELVGNVREFIEEQRGSFFGRLLQRGRDFIG